MSFDFVVKLKEFTQALPESGASSEEVIQKLESIIQIEKSNLKTKKNLIAQEVVEKKIQEIYGGCRDYIDIAKVFLTSLRKIYKEKSFEKFGGCTDSLPKSFLRTVLSSEVFYAPQILKNPINPLFFEERDLCENFKKTVSEDEYLNVLAIFQGFASFQNSVFARSQKMRALKSLDLFSQEYFLRVSKEFFNVKYEDEWYRVAVSRMSPNIYTEDKFFKELNENLEIRKGSENKVADDFFIKVVFNIEDSSICKVLTKIAIIGDEMSLMDMHSGNVIGNSFENEKVQEILNDNLMNVPKSKNKYLIFV